MDFKLSPSGLDMNVESVFKEFLNTLREERQMLKRQKSKLVTKQYLDALEKKRKLTNVNKEYGKLGEKGKLYNYPLIDDFNNYIPVNSGNIRLHRIITQTGSIIRSLLNNKKTKKNLQNQIINTVKQIGDKRINYVLHKLRLSIKASYPKPYLNEPLFIRDIVDSFSRKEAKQEVEKYCENERATGKEESSLNHKYMLLFSLIGDYMSVCTLPDIIRQLEILDSDDTLVSPLPLACHPEYTFYNVYIKGGKQTYRYSYTIDTIPNEHFSKEKFKFDYLKLNEKIRNPYYRKDILNVPVRNRQTEVSE